MINNIATFTTSSKSIPTKYFCNKKVHTARLDKNFIFWLRKNFVQPIYLCTIEYILQNKI